MKKTFNINICGTSFTIDDDAYVMLSEYLDTLRKAYSHSGDPQDFMEDIEMRIAELLFDRPGGREAIVSIDEVEKIIHRLGRPEEIEDLEVESDETTVEQKVTMEEKIVPPPYIPPVKHNLYRNPDGKMLGGVCSGIAAYFGINVAWIRLIFIILFFASFSLMFLLYIILWLVIPMACTPLQKLELRGQQPTVENIGESVRNVYSEPQENNDGCLAGILKVGVAILLIIALPALVLVGLIMVICLVVMFSALLGAEFGSEDCMYVLRVFFICVAIGIPLSAIAYVGLNYKKDSKHVKTSWFIAFAIVWIASIVGSRMLGEYLDSRNDKSTLQIYSAEIESDDNASAREDGVEMVTDAPGYENGKKKPSLTISLNRQGSKIMGIQVKKDNPDSKTEGAEVEVSITKAAADSLAAKENAPEQSGKTEKTTPPEKQ